MPWSAPLASVVVNSLAQPARRICSNKAGNKGRILLHGHPVENVSHVGGRGHLADAKDRLQVPLLAPLLHFALKLQQVGILKKHHGNATPQGVRQAIVNPIRSSRVGDGQGLRDQFDHGFQGQTVYGTHDVSRQLISQYGAQSRVIDL